MCYRTAKYTICRRVRATFSPEILQAGAVKGLKCWGSEGVKISPRIFFLLKPISSQQTNRISVNSDGNGNIIHFISAFSSSPAFQDNYSPQTSCLMVLLKLVVCTRSSLTAEHALGFVAGYSVPNVGTHLYISYNYLTLHHEMSLSTPNHVVGCCYCCLFLI